MKMKHIKYFAKIVVPQRVREHTFLRRSKRTGKIILTAAAAAAAAAYQCINKTS